MWGKGRLQLATAIIMAFISKAAAINPQQIGITPHALVPTYIGCRDEALKKFIQSGLLQQELNKSADFNQAWTTAKACSKVMPGRLKEHSTALMVFQEEKEPFFTDFNKAVESANDTTYRKQFHFKSFHFLLMDSMTKVALNQCKTVYILAEEGYSVKKGSSVRFKRFTKAVTKTAQIPDLNAEILLKITSCFFAETVCNPRETLILSPAEVFTVEDVKPISDVDDGDYTMIVLNHQSVKTSQDCSMLSRSPPDGSTQWLVLVLAALCLFHINV